MQKTEVIFVAACQSSFVMESFKKCGASHIICVEKKQSILDKAAIQFAKTFYDRLMSNKSVCKAFEIAKKDVEFYFDRIEADKFRLHRSDNART